MDKCTAVKAALCIMAVIASTSSFAERLWLNTRPAGGVCLGRGELSGAPLRATAPGIPDDLDSPPGNGSLPADKAGPEGKAPPSQIKLDIILGLQGIEWVILGDHSGGSMQVRTLRRRYSSSRSP